MRLAERELKQLAAATGSNEKAVSRLLGSIRLRIPSGTEGTEGLPQFREMDVGLRLQSPEVMTTLSMTHGREGALKLLEDALRGYFSASPTVCGWIGRGDFRPDEIPSTLSRGALVHACRTAGRLRAKVLRG